MSKYSYHQKGFSLVEALVAMTVFGLALGLLAGIMSNSLRQQRKINAEQQLAGNTRDVIESIAREIRLDSIDYTKHLITQSESLADPLDHLYLTNGVGEAMAFSRNAATNDVELNGSPINSNNIDIKTLSFYIRPTSDPFYLQSCTIATEATDCDLTQYPVKSATCLSSGMCELVNEQPRVTIVINAELRGVADASRQSTINLQTTVSTRRYQR